MILLLRGGAPWPGSRGTGRPKLGLEPGSVYRLKLTLLLWPPRRLSLTWFPRPLDHDASLRGSLVLVPLSRRPPTVLPATTTPSDQYHPNTAGLTSSHTVCQAMPGSGGPLAQEDSYSRMRPPGRALNGNQMSQTFERFNSVRNGVY